VALLALNGGAPAGVRPRASDTAIPHRYPTGTPSGPSQPLGSLHRLAEVFLRDLQADWAQHGKDVLEVMRKKHPESTSNALHWFKGPSLTSPGRSSSGTHPRK
jgi:hypothetical protein